MVARVNYPANFAVVDGVVCRGARPTTVAETMTLEKDFGVRTVLNLEWEASDDDAWVGGAVRLVRVRDFEPLPFFAPSSADGHIIHALAEIRRGSARVYVHCRSGRTGVIIAAYRIVALGQDIESVLTDFSSYRGWWAWADERYIRSLPPRREELRRRITSLKIALS